MRRAVLILAVSAAVSSAFTGPCFPIGRGALTSRQQRGICLQMTDNLDKADVEVCLTPFSEVYGFHFFIFLFCLYGSVYSRVLAVQFRLPLFSLPTKLNSQMTEWDR